MTYQDIFGRLTIDALPFTAFIESPSVNEAVASAAASIVVVGAAAVLFILTRYRLWGPLWRDWLTSTDHKNWYYVYRFCVGDDDARRDRRRCYALSAGLWFEWGLSRT
ncbi:hypothetical protein [Sphingopyxis sp. BSNA05]|uniref:hypothetical protein n=1 Tax=Sphingopyxis sp. BSNA05 TaxID=1236614 RepID=UPI00349F7F4C